MFRNYILINILLLTAIVFLGVKFYDVLSYPNDIPNQDSIKGSGMDSVLSAGKERKLNIAAVQVIERKDLFNPLRTSSPPKQKPRTIVKQKDIPVLYGTIIMDGERRAIMKSPGDKSTRIFFKNDRVAGFLVSDIREDKVILVQDDEEIELRLRNKKTGVPKSSVKPKAKPRRRRVSRRPKTSNLAEKLTGSAPHETMGDK